MQSFEADLAAYPDLIELVQQLFEAIRLPTPHSAPPLRLLVNVLMVEQFARCGQPSPLKPLSCKQTADGYGQRSADSEL